MNDYTDESPIIACCTGTNSNTAVAVIRLSGFQSILDLQKFFSFNLGKIKPRYSHLTNIVYDNKLYDNVLICYFPNENSYTGENVLEVHAHGNILNVNRIIQLFISFSNFRSALPGEFSYRALKNNKLTLSQVEGLDLLLNANSNLMLSQGLDILQGELHSNYLKIYDDFLKMKSAIELLIDFSDDVGEENARSLYLTAFKNFTEIIDSLYSRSQGHISSLLNPEIAIVGQTNAGKSSLFNILLSQNRSIVSSIAGTTRDYVSDTIYIDGTHYSLIDTAGVRESSDEIEKIGIERAMNIFERSFFKILVVDPLSFDKNYPTDLQNSNVDLLVISHSDCPDFIGKIRGFDFIKFKFSNIVFSQFSSGSIGPIFDTGSIGPDTFNEIFGPIGPKIISGPIGPNLQTGSIGPLIRELVSKKYAEISKVEPILLERHRQVISAIYDLIHDGSRNFKDLRDAGLASDNVNSLSRLTADLIGLIKPDDVLNSVFANFCIGK